METQQKALIQETVNTEERLDFLHDLRTNLWMMKKKKQC